MSDRPPTLDDLKRAFPARDPRKLQLVLLGDRVWSRGPDGNWYALDDADAPHH
jgi:hypothetical protein